MQAALLTGLATFLLMVPWGGWVVRALLSRGIGKNIREDGPASHQSKAGTATMGGLYILGGVTAAALVLAANGFLRPLGPLVAMLSYGLLGAFDDLQGLRDRQGVGWLARNKFPWQWGLAAVLGGAAYALYGQEVGVVPFTGVRFALGWWLIPLLGVALVAISNAANLTDGLDGLAAGTLAIAYGAYGVLALHEGQRGLALFCFAVVGAVAAFLWFNIYPARLFMGDTGSQALGAGLAAVAVLSGHWLILPLVGLVLVAEALSVMLQVGYFKYTRRRYGEGRRILRMAPLHHHFELGGWSEVQVTLRLWIVAGLAAAAGLIAGLVRL